MSRHYMDWPRPHSTGIVRAVCTALPFFVVPWSGAVGQQHSVGGALGIYDDLQLTATTGTMGGSFKHLYIGFRNFLPYNGFTGFEFSISGLEPFAWSVEFLIEPTIVVGTLAAPADSATGTGGIDIAYNSCFDGDRAFIRLSLWALSPPRDHTLKVLRKFPPSSPTMTFPFYITCDGCAFCWAHVVAGTYVLNPDMAVECRSWGAIKGLYSGR